MPWYGPDPIEAVLAAREKGRDSAEASPFEALDVNFNRRPWVHPDSRVEQPSNKFDPITLGDADFDMRRYLVDAQVPSAHAETLRNEAATQAQDALEKYGHIVDPKTRAKWAEIAQSGTPDTSNWFTNLINILDAPGELIRMGIADLFVDSKVGVEITGRDYWDAILGNEDKIRQRLGIDLVGEGQFLFEGERLAAALGLDVNADEATAGRQRFSQGLLFDILTDPLTYISFGTLGLGKKVAIEAAQAGIAKAGREAVEAVSKGTVRNLTDEGSKEIAQRITRRIDNEVAGAGKDPISRMAARDNITHRVIAEEKRALDLMSGQALPKRDILGEVPIPTGTAIESAVNDVLPHLADKQFKTLASEAPWYMQSSHVPNFSKGGLQIGAPFGRKKFPMLRIPGTETNRRVSQLLGRGVKDNIMSKMPEGFQAMMRRLAERTGIEKDVFKRAKAGTLWQTESAKTYAQSLLGDLLTESHVSAFRHGVKGIEAAAQEAGVEVADAHRMMRELLSGSANPLSEAPPVLRAALEEGVFGDAQAGVAGIRDVFNTFYDAARRVGLEIGRVENYVPMVIDGKFGRLLDDITDLGVDLSMDMLGRATSTESRVGMEILARYLHNTGASALGFSGVDPGFTQFAKTNRITSIWRNALGGHQISESIGLDEVLELGTFGRLTPDQANAAVRAAFDDLVQFDPKVTRKMAEAFDEAFVTDMNKVLSLYTTSMTEAIQFRALIRELRRLNLVGVGERAIDVSASLASVSGRLTPEVAKWIDEVAELSGSDRASRLVKTKIGGRSFNVPAAVAANPRFAQAKQRLGVVFSRMDRRGKEIRSAVENRAAKLIADGVPDEWAHDLALAASDTELTRAMNDIGEAVFDEILTLEMAVAEMGARGVGETDSLIMAARAEAERIRAGAVDMMVDLDAQVRKAIDVAPPARSAEAIDLLDPSKAPRGYATPIQWLADQAEQSMLRAQGTVQDMVRADQALTGRLQGASRAEIAREAAFDLSDRLVVSNATVGDLVEFAGPRTAARLLGEANLRLLDSGYAGVGSLTDEIQSAVDEVLMAERTLLEATQIGEGVTEAQDFLRQAESNLDEVAGALEGSDELLGAIMENVAESVDDINDAILSSPIWRDMWATALHKQPIERGLAKLSPEDIAEGLEDLTVKELTQRHAKGVARENADQVRDLWAMASTAETNRLAQRAAEASMQGPSPLRKAFEAMKAADRRALPAYGEQIRQIISRITDDAGRPLFNPSRLTIRPNGSIVYEPAQATWVTLGDVLNDIIEVVADPDLPIVEQLAILREAWEATPEAIGEVSDSLATFMRQLDNAGGLPAEIEDWQYLKSFVADLEQTSEQLQKIASTTFDPELQRQIAENPEEWAFHGTFRGFEDMRDGGVTTSLKKAEEWARGTVERRGGNPIVVAVKRSDLASNVRRGLDENGVVAQLPKGHPPIRVRGSHYVDQVPDLAPPAGVKKVSDVLEEVSRVFGRQAKTSRKLTRIWAESAEAIEEALPAEEFDRLARLVGLAEASGHIRPTKMPTEWRTLVGDMEQTFDLFNRDVAHLWRQSRDEGMKWAEGAAEDAAYFREKLLELMSFADDHRRQIRPGFINLDEYGGNFEQTLNAARGAAKKLKSDLKKTRKKGHFVEFLPEIPENAKSFEQFHAAVEKALSEWQAVPAAKATKNMIDLKVSHLAGSSVEGLVAEPSVALWLENMASMAATLPSPMGLRMVAESVREAEKWWKGAATVARPTFVPRNIMGGIVNGLLIGVGPRQYAFVNRHAHTLRRLVEGGMLPDDAIRQLPAKVRPYFEALWESKLLHKSFSHTLEGLQSATRIGSKVNPFSHANYAFKAGGRFMETSEDFLRAAAFVRWYDPNNPATMRLAKEMALAVHFDYSSLTKLETSIKRFVPFFIWTRRNIPLQLRAMVEQPGHLMRFVHLKENIEAELSRENNWVDELKFARSPYLSFFSVGTGLVFDADTPFWQRLIIDPDLPLADIEEITKAMSGGPKEWGEWVIRSLSPTYSAPLEIFADYDTVAPTGLREILMAADWVAPGEGVFGFEPAQGRVPQYQGPAVVGRTFSTIFPFLGEWTRIAGLVPSDRAEKAGYNIEDGVQLEERLKAAALGLGRAFGTHLQTPGDTRSQAWEAIFDVEDDIESLQQQGSVFKNEEDLYAFIETLLAREGLTGQVDPESVIADLDISS